jgi:hypothetical protein
MFKVMVKLDMPHCYRWAPHGSQSSFPLSIKSCNTTTYVSWCNVEGIAFVHIHIGVKNPLNT